jgi:hypothetical protein
MSIIPLHRTRNQRALVSGFVGATTMTIKGKIFLLCCSLLGLFCGPTLSQISILDLVSVTQVQGQIHLFLKRDDLGKPAEGVVIQLKRRSLHGDFKLVAETRTDSNGFFGLPATPKGSYALFLSMLQLHLDVDVKVRGWRPFRGSNWFEISLGLIQPEGCPPSRVKAIRKQRKVDNSS